MLDFVYLKVISTFQVYCLVPFASPEQHILEERIELLILLYRTMLVQRYFARCCRRQRPINKFKIDLSQTILQNYNLPWLNEVEFLNAYRVTKSAFWKIVHEIQHHPIFTRKRGPCQQPVAHQLMILLHYLGTAGSVSSNHRMRNHFQIGYGSVINYRRRVITAIRESLRATYYCWPDVEERHKIAEEIQREFLFPNCLGAIDGTTFPLMTKPKRVDFADFKGRKDGYTLSGLFIFDNRRRIRYYNTGWAGSAHDNRIFTNSSIYKNHRTFFSHNEYILGDSAFQEEPFCIPSYRNPTGTVLSGTKEGFNKILGRIRVVSEHGFGNLKGRFPILSCIPIVLTHDPSSMWEILNVIDTCVILHNFIAIHNENYDEPFFYTHRVQHRIRDPIGQLPEDDELNREIPDNSPRGLRREQLRAYFSENNLI